MAVRMHTEKNLFSLATAEIGLTNSSVKPQESPGLM